MTERDQSRPDFHTLFEAAPGLYVVLLPDAPRYTIVAATDAYACATMTSREEILGRGLFEVCPDNPSDPAATGVSTLRTSLGRVLTTRLPDAMAVQKYDIRRPAESGGEFEERWWSPKNSPVIGPGGDVAYIIHAIEDVTEKHRLEEERQLFAALVENSSDFIGIADPEGRPIYVNPAGRRMVGLAPDHPVSETQIPEYYPPEERPFVSDVIVKGIVEQGRWSGETRFRHWKTGAAIPVSDEHFMIRDARGRVLGMGTITRDISEARRVAAECEQLLAQSKALFDQASDGLFIADPNCCFTDVNAAACRMLGYAREELIGKAIADTMSPEDVPRLAATREYLLSPGAVQVAEWTQLRKDGTPIPVELSAKILPDGRWQAFVRDISERKRAERTLQESEERFRLTFDEAPIGMALMAPDGRFVRVNRVLCEIVGCTSSELTGLTFQAITHPDDLDADLALAGQLALGEIPRYQLGKRYIRKDGTIVDTVLSASIVRSRDGVPLYYISQIEDVTERKRAEEALRISEAKFSGIVSIAADAIISIDDDQRITIFNDGAEKMFGYSKSEVIGASLDILLPDRLRSAHRQHIERFARGNVTARRMGERLTTIVGLRKNGEEFPVEAAISKLQVGAKTHMTVVLRDITERKRIEDELKDANASLEAIIENIPLMLFIKDGTSLRFLRFNRACEDLLGRPRHMLVGKSDYDLWPQAQAEFFVEKDRATLASGKIVDIPEEPIQTRYQGIRLLHTKKVPVLDAAGKPIYLLGISEDITERRRIEKQQQFLAEVSVALSVSLDYEQTMATVARLVVQNVADWCAIDVLDEQGQLRRLKVTSADPEKAALCAVLERMPPNRGLPHITRSVIESKRPLIIEHVTPEYVESVAQGPEHLQALLATGVTSFVAMPLLLRGEPLGAILLGYSTPSHFYGHGDLRLAEALADRAAVAIENARLYRASVNATHLRDQVLGVVAHDLRNPLSTILLQASALKRQGPEPERRSQKPREVIHRAVTHMNRLIQDLLDVALMESGQLTIERGRASARELIVAAVEMQSSLASSSSLELRVDLDPDDSEIWGDRDRLLQVFENLIGNAIKFTKPGGRVTVGAASRDREVVFRVADTGCGIASENLPRVFDRFWQATRAGREGAGLGLPITKGIVEAHGGRIWVESTPGQGTAFSFTIPKPRPEQERPADASGSLLWDRAASPS